MNKRTIISSLALIATVIAGASYAEAYNGHRGNGGYNADCIYQDGRGYYQGKELSEKEMNKLNEQRLKHRESMAPLFDELRTKRMELNALKYNPNTKPEQLSDLVKDISSLENKIDAEQESFRTKIQKDFGIEYYGGYGRQKCGRNYGYHENRHGYMHRNHY